MEEGKEGGQEDIRVALREVLEEFLKGEQKRESLEQRVNELAEENRKAKAVAEESERSAAVRAELQRQGVAKLDLAYRAIKDDIFRGEDGRLLAQGGVELKDHVAQFVMENPELLPARMAGGSGSPTGQRSGPADRRLDLDQIRPGMSAEEMERVRQEIARVASQALRGQ